MSGARYFRTLKEERARRALKERREQERVARLDLQDQQLARVDTGKPYPMYRCTCGVFTRSCVACDNCFRELMS